MQSVSPYHAHYIDSIDVYIGTVYFVLQIDNSSDTQPAYIGTIG